MKANKKVVFISHIHEEKEVAFAFKELIEESFINLIDVFVSSDGESISMGAKWLESISDALKNCAVEVIACSPLSIQRPWIHFEAGAGWVRSIPIIPLCHSGLTPSKLPIPLNLLNGATASERSSVELMLPVIAKALGSSVPRCDFSTYLSRVSTFEKQYTFWDTCNRALRMINLLHVDMLKHLQSGKTVTIPLNEKQIAEVDAYANFLRDNNVIHYDGRKVMILGPIPTFECEFRALADLAKTLSAAECKL